MGHLNTLPVELLLKIIALIPDPIPDDSAQDANATWGVPGRPLADYCSLALTCHALNRAATSILYEKYDHIWDHLTSLKFIKTLIANPHLAGLVKEMNEIGRETRQWEPEQFDPQKGNRETIRIICTEIKALQIPEAEIYIDLFRKQRDRMQNLQAALITFLTPNIEIISVKSCPGLEKASRTWPCRWKSRHLPATLLPTVHAAQGIPYGKVHSFNNLRKLKIMMLGLHINFISPILQLESLRDLVLLRYTEPGFDLEKPPCAWRCPPRSSNIRNIRLEDFDFHLGSLQALISACRRLTAFSFTVPFSNTPVPQWSQLINLLVVSQPGLEALEIEDQCERAGDCRRLGHLRELSALKILFAPMELLIDQSNTDESRHLGNILPASLRTFHISKGNTSFPEWKLARATCNEQIRTLLNSCHDGNMFLQRFFISYTTTLSEKVGNILQPSRETEALKETDDLDFDFVQHAVDFKSCGIYFDFVIKVEHSVELEAEDRLIPIGILHGKAVVEEYKNHLASLCFEDPQYQLQGVTRPAIFNSDGEEF